MKRWFDRTSLLRPGGARVPGYVIDCSSCGGKDEIAATGHSGVLPPDVLTKKWKQRGWKIGRKSATCPACNGTQQEKPMATQAAADAPRQPTPADKRRIFREIDDHWNEEKSRYEGSTTDQTIATGLDVPRAWVTQIREDAFGKSQRNEDMDKVLGNLKNLKGECDRAMSSAMELAEKFEALSKQCVAMQEAINGIV
jgi:hypothetical protein